MLHKIAKQQLIDYYIKQSRLIAHQLVSLLSINDGYELSVLFNLPQTTNINILQTWAIDYLIKHEVEINTQYVLNEIAEVFQYEVAIKQQDFYL